MTAPIEAADPDQRFRRNLPRSDSRIIEVSPVHEIRLCHIEKAITTLREEYGRNRVR
jgi:hypothetical protein